MLTTTLRTRGFTLIEMLIGIAIVVLLMVIAVPAFNHWIVNTRIRNAAEGILNGMQIAKAEAVQRNTIVQSVIGADSSWTVSLPLTGEQVQARPAVDGADGVAVAILPAGADRITFNGMGWVVANDDASPSITQVDITSATMAGPEVRALRVVLGTGGSMRMCDPALAAGDPRAC